MFDAIPEEYKLIIIVGVLAVLCFFVMANNRRNQSRMRDRRGRDFKTNYMERRKELEEEESKKE